MSECANIRGLLALQRDDWSAEEARRVEAHLSGCQECAAIAEAYAEQDRWSRAMPPVTLTPDQREHVLARVRGAARDRRAPARREALSRLAGGAAAVAIVALLALGLAMLFQQMAQRRATIGPGEGTPSAAIDAPWVSSPLAGSEWVLTSLNGAPLLDGTYITVNFEDRQLGGFAGCNAYGGGPDSGGYRATDDGTLTIPQFAITAMDCTEPAGVMEQEQAYVEALHSAVFYRLVDDRLELADASAQTMLVYARQPAFQGNPAELLGTTWQLLSLDGESPAGSRPITLAFQLAGEATGDAGCRAYTATYEATGGDLRFLSTEMVGDVCADQALLEQEEEYTTVLGWTRHYRLAPGQLELFTARGETLSFIAMPAGPGGQGDAPTPAPTLVSPPAGSDLGKLAWVQDGDVWVRALPDGEPLRLTDDGRNSEPRWSTSGEWLAYRKETQVWLVRANGQDAYALDAGGVIDTFAWSPADGPSADDRLAYVAGSGMLRLEVLHAGETQPLSLLPPGAEDQPGEPGTPGRIAWSPDGVWIAYEWRRGMAGYEGLWKIPANGGEPVELYDSGLGQGGDPQPGEALLAGWTADGGYLLFWQGEMLSASLLADGAPFYALPAEGGPAVLLAGGDDVVLYHDDFWSAVSGGSYLALTMGGGRETWTNKRIAIADAETGQVQTFTDGTVAAFSPVLSPDRAKIAYVAGPDVGFVGGGEEGRAAVFQRHIWVIGDDAASSGDGPVPRQLTDDPAYRDERPLWSADGGQILFVRMDQQEQVSLWLLPAEDTEARQVAGGLGPLPGPETGWFGYYGYVDWDTLFDWWQTPVQAAPPPNPTPVPTPEPLPTVQPGEADREAGSAACAEARSGQPPVGLVVEEHPLLGPPGSPEETADWFQTADGPTGEILAARAAYRDSAALLLAEDNRALEPFGYRLELDRCGDAFNATYRLYRDGQVYRSGITAFSPVSVNASGTAFVVQLELGGLPYTLTESSLQASGQRPAYAAYVGDDLVTVQVSDTLRVKLGAQPVYDVPVGNELAYLVPLQDRQTSHGLESPWSYDGRWAIEWGETTAENAFPEAGHVVVDGQDLNSSCGYDEVFNFTLLGGRPFYFFEQGGKVNLAYDGQVVGADYDSIPHYRCCSGAVVNPGVSPNMVWFFATRGEQWYYVEVYVPLAEMPTATLCPAP